MKRFVCLLSSSLLVCLPGLAHADIYKCVSSSGQITYTNAKPASHTQGCTVMTHDQPFTTAPAQTSTQKSRPTNFPKVDSQTQKRRDDDRRQILENELESEKQALDAAQKELSAQEAVRNGNEKNYQKYLDRVQPYKDTVTAHQRNIDALNKELEKLQ